MSRIARRFALHSARTWYSVLPMRRWILCACVIAVVLAAAGLALRHDRRASGAAPTPASQQPPDVTLRQIHMVETRDGVKLWELLADRAEVHEQEGYTLLTQERHPVEVILFSNQGRLSCTATRATIDMKTRDVRLEGAVHATSDQGTELTTELLRWRAASKRVQTDRPVTISRGGLVSRGRGLEAETDLERVRIFQNITSQLAAPTGGAPIKRSGPALR